MQIKVTDAIINQSTIPCIKGFIPTFFKASLDKLAPIQNKVRIKAFSEICFINK